MKLLSINIAMPTAIELGNETVTTGICKLPIQGTVMMRALGLDGDGQGNAKHHGGPDQAVFAYAAEHYDHWRRELGRDDLAYGLMGENLTVRGWMDEDVCIGDTYKVGGAIVRVTGPRIPCGKLEHRVGVKGFAKRYAQSKRFGIYLHIVEPGEFRAGDEVDLIEKSPAGFGLVELAELLLYRPDDTDGMRRALKVKGLGERCQTAFKERIAKAEQAS